MLENALDNALRGAVKQPTSARRPMTHDSISPLRVSILTGGRDPHYAVPLISSLASQPAFVDVIGSDLFLTDELLGRPNVKVFNLHVINKPHASAYKKLLRLAVTYGRLIAYAARTDSQLFHILWLTKAELVDTIILLPAFKLLGKTLVFTAHNVDAGERDGRMTTIGSWMLRRLYRLMDHIFVHTERMKHQLHQDFGVDRAKVTVIPYGLNTAVPESCLTKRQARDKLALGANERIALFFGHITAYKGLEYLIEAIAILKDQGWHDLRLVVAGGVKDRPSAIYYQTLLATIDRLGIDQSVIRRTEFIPDEEIEVYFKCADVCVLPYKTIFQSGVLFLAYRFGLPVVATDVGSLRSDVVEGRTGFICRSEDPQHLAEKLKEFFHSNLCNDFEQTSQVIRRFAEEEHSWSIVVATTYDVYRACLGRSTAGATGRSNSTPGINRE